MPDRSEPAPRAEQGCLYSFLAHFEAGEVLDAACGGGEFTELLVNHLNGFHRLIGVDPDKDSLDEARLLFDDRRIRFARNSIEELTYASGRFALVTVSNALHHLERPLDALRRLWELVAPGGALLLHEMIADELDAAEINYRDLHHLKAAIDRQLGSVHNSTYTHDDLRRLVSEAATALRPGRPAPQLLLDCVEASAPEGDESVTARLEFIEEYVSRVRDRSARERFDKNLARLHQRVLVDGLQVPRRAVIALGRSREPSE